ncbi:MAG TPA: DUF192 domain-containing protein [Acidimicrobiales bacterium]|nr:DUF192 domain-containing protein [Acidimicrobiales bacterium]
MSGAHSRRRDDAKTAKALGWVVAALAVASVIGLFLVGADGPSDPELAGLSGFGEVGFAVTPAGPGAATARQFCALLAETAEQRARGLMGRRDLAGDDAMVFRFDADTNDVFYMRNVPVPLGIAWFGADGRFVSSTEMAPCPDREGCPTYAASGPYRVAVEVPKGGLDRLGIGEGSTLTVGGPCPS